MLTAAASGSGCLFFGDVAMVMSMWLVLAWLFEWRCGCQDGDGSRDGEMAMLMPIWLW